MYTRRDMFRLLTGAAAMAAVPGLMTGTAAAVADRAGRLLAMDGSLIAVKDYPELAQYLINLERDQLYEWRAYSAQFTPRYPGSETQCHAWRALQNHKPVLSECGAYVRLPDATDKAEEFHGYNEDNQELWATYKTYIQALPDDRRFPVGSRFVAVDRIYVKGLEVAPR